MVCVAVAAAAPAIAARWSIARAERPPLGRKAALVALLLSLLCGTWGITWRTVRERVICRDAQQLADQWLQLVRAGNLREAHQLHLSRQERQAPGANLEEYYKNTHEPVSDLDSFYAAAPLSQIVAAGQQGQVRFLACEDVQDESYAGIKRDVANLRYALDQPADGQLQTVPFLLTIARVVDRQKAEANWELRGVRAPDKRR